MARLPRLAVAGFVHYVMQRGHNGGRVVHDETDRRALLGACLDASRAHQTLVHAYAIRNDELHLLIKPPSALAMSTMMQDIGRRHASAFNRRHARSGALWDSRYRAAVLESGAVVLDALMAIDTMRAPPDMDPAREVLWTGVGHRLGLRRDDMLTDPPEYWELGNTPFDREACYRERLALRPPPAQPDPLREAVLHGWAVGSPAFIAQLESLSGRPMQPRPRGRPRRVAG